MSEPLYARVESGRVVHVLPRAEVPPADDVAMACVGSPGRLQYLEIPEGFAVEPGWLWTEAGFTPLPAAPPPLPEALEIAASSAQRAFEAAGVVADGFKVGTDERSMARLSAQRALAAKDDAHTTAWKTRGGPSQTIDAATILTLYDAAAAHINQGFEIYGALTTGIYADPPTITTFAQVEAAFADPKS